MVMKMVNSFLFQDFMGALDGNGKAAAQMNLPPVPGFAGTTLTFAYAINAPWDFASNPVAVEIVP
jgi:hypothetical protein